MALGSSAKTSAESGGKSVYYSNKIPKGTMRMIAHAGYSAIAPSNTLPAYRAAGESDFWGAECDIQHTKDGVWVLMHDDTVERTTDGEGAVKDLTYNEILEFNIDDGNNLDKYPNTKVPTLEEYLDVCKQYSLHPVIEVKATVDVASMDGLCEILSAREDKDMFVIITFGRELCLKIKESAPDIPVYLLVDEKATQNDIDFAVNNHLDGMDIHVYSDKEFIKAVTKTDLDLIVWTIDDYGSVNRFYKYGITAITSNTFNESEPEGSIFKKIIWKVRDFIYSIKN